MKVDNSSLGHLSKSPLTDVAVALENMTLRYS